VFFTLTSVNCINNDPINRNGKEIEQEIKKKDSIIQEYNELLKLINDNRRLKQYVVAMKYAKLEPTKENIRKFLKDAEVLRPEESFQVALRETDNGNTGIGRKPHNNHFGMKITNTRFSWSIDVMPSNYVEYESWTTSYLDYDEFLRKGYKTWRKDVKKYSTVTTVNAHVTVIVKHKKCKMNKPCIKTTKIHKKHRY